MVDQLRDVQHWFLTRTTFDPTTSFQGTTLVLPTTHTTCTCIVMIMFIMQLMFFFFFFFFAAMVTCLLQWVPSCTCSIREHAENVTFPFSCDDFPTCFLLRTLYFVTPTCNWSAWTMLKNGATLTSYEFHRQLPSSNCLDWYRRYQLLPSTEMDYLWSTNTAAFSQACQRLFLLIWGYRYRTTVAFQYAADGVQRSLDVIVFFSRSVTTS